MLSLAAMKVGGQASILNVTREDRQREGRVTRQFARPKHKRLFNKYEHKVVDGRAHAAGRAGPAASTPCGGIAGPYYMAAQCDTVQARDTRKASRCWVPTRLFNARTHAALMQ